MTLRRACGLTGPTSCIIDCTKPYLQWGEAGCSSQLRFPPLIFSPSFSPFLFPLPSSSLPSFLLFPPLLFPTLLFPLFSSSLLSSSLLSSSFFSPLPSFLLFLLFSSSLLFPSLLFPPLIFSPSFSPLSSSLLLSSEGFWVGHNTSCVAPSSALESYYMGDGG